MLRRGEGDRPFQLTRSPPTKELAEIVHAYWSVRWSLGTGTHSQEVLPHPAIQLVVEEGVSGVFRISRRKAVRRLRGDGFAFGIRFLPGTFRSIWQEPLSALSSPRIPLDVAFGDSGRRYERDVLAAKSDERRVELAEAFLRDREPALDDAMRRVRDVVQLIESTPELLTVEAVAEACGTKVRTLQRLFHSYVGASPKWVIRRVRIHGAVAALEAGEHRNLAALAADLGYFDQAHFSREFTLLVGRSPLEYRKGLS